MMLSLLLAVLLGSWILTFLMMRYALAKKMIDVPNERSSHTTPTPRGGGVAIVVAFNLALPCLSLLNVLSLNALYGLWGAGIAVAVIGFADDHGHIPARWRLLGHFSAASWALYWMNGFAPLTIYDAPVDLGVMGTLLGMFYLVWLLNLYNFMDGIDGLASIEAITTCLGLALVYWCSGYLDQVWLALLLAASVLGFLYWNFSPARIFMGDAGSGFLGVSLAVIILYGAWLSPELFWSGLILLGAFIVDATWTLIVRLVNGEKVHVAHSNHAYQHAARYFASHKLVTLGVISINIVWLLPLSLMVGLKMLSGIVGLMIAYIPICILVWKFKGGRPA